MSKLLNKIEENEALLWEIGFLMVYAVVLTILFLEDTHIGLLIGNDPGYRSKRYWIILLTIIFVIVKTARTRTFTLPETLFVGFGALALGRCVQVAGYDELVIIGMLILGAKDVSFKNILKVYLAVAAILTLVVIGMCLKGTIPDWTWEKSGRAVHAFGFYYCNEFSAHIFFLSAAYIMVREEKIHLLELAGLVILGAVVYRLTGSRTSLACELLLTAAVVLCKIQRKNQRWISWTCVAVSILCVIGMIGASVLFRWESVVLVRMNALFSNRLQLGHDAFSRIGLSLFGKAITMIGVTYPVTDYANYNFLDCSFLMILFQFGIMTVVALIWGFILIFRKILSEQNQMIAVVIAVIFIQCTMEHHLLDMEYCPVILASLAYLSRINLSKDVRNGE